MVLRYLHCSKKLCLKYCAYKRVAVSVVITFSLMFLHIILLPSFSKSYNDDCNISKESMNTLRNMLALIIEVFEKNNVFYWLDYGTLLGASNFEDVIPWDSDGDISFLKDDPNLPRSLMELAGHGIQANTMIADMGGMRIDFVRWVKGYGFYKGENTSMLYKHYPPWVKDNIIMILNHRLEAFPSSWIGKRKRIPFLSKYAYIPIEMEKMLGFRYKWTYWFNMPYKWKCYVPCIVYKQLGCDE